MSKVNIETEKTSADQDSVDSDPVDRCPVAQRQVDNGLTDHGTIEQALCELRKLPDYPFCREKDSPFLSGLVDEFPSIDLVMEIRHWSAWLMDNESIKKKKVNYRSRLRRWCVNAVKFAKEKEKTSRGKYAFEKKQPGEGHAGRVTEVW